MIWRQEAPLELLKHLVQTQVLDLKVSRLTPLSSIRFEADLASWTGTVVDFVTVKTTGFNSFQHPSNFLMLNLKEFHEECRVEHLVPNQIQRRIELY